MSPEQLGALAEELPAAARAVFSVCRFTAARVSEALNLRWENVMQSEVVIPKMIAKKKMKTRLKNIFGSRQKRKVRKRKIQKTKERKKN